MNNNILAEVSREMIERYSNRFKKFGHHVHTLGWGSQEQQAYRFAQTLLSDNINDQKTVLDIGCGFGDYLAFLSSSGKTPSKYTGWDINPDLISEAKKIWASHEHIHFETVDLGMLQHTSVVADVAVMLGVLNLNLKERIDNYGYSFSLIKKAFECTKELLVVDFLSSKTNASYPKEDFVFYHEPATMLEFALSLSSNVILKHDYAAIPQKEFMLFIAK